MTEYRIQVCSDVDYENLIAEVYLGEKFVALVSREKADGAFDVEFPGPEQNESAITRKIEFATLLEALTKAKEELSNEE